MQFYIFRSDFCSVIGSLGSWSSWNDYGECSVTCGTGSQTRTRECVAVPGGGGGIAIPGRRRKRSTCTGNSMQTQECWVQSCPGNTLDIDLFLADLKK